MARKARVVADGVPHHIPQRGNHRQDVLLLSEDRRFYLETLRAKCAQHRVAILGYCLLTNHLHLVRSRSAAMGSPARWAKPMAVTRNASTGAIAAGVTWGRTALIPVL
jgi:REP element-mobilizing transposase RayT